MNDDGPNRLVIRAKANGNISLTHNTQHAIFVNCGDICIVNSPLSVLGQISRTTRCAYAECRNLHRPADADILTLGAKRRMIEGVRSRRSRDHHQRRADLALIAIGRAVNNYWLIRALLLCHKCAGATTIKIDCLYTTSIEHNLCYFLGTTTGGEGFLTTVKNHKDNLSVSRNANASARCTIVVVVRGGSNGDFTVLD